MRSVSIQCCSPHSSAALGVIIGLIIPALAWGRAGTLAIVNARREGGSESVLQAGQLLKAYVGGWARQKSITEYLAGQPNPGALPAGDVGRDLVVLVEKVRMISPSPQDLTALGRLLDVDYLLLVTTYSRHFTARLYSVRTQRFSPQGLEASLDQLGLLKSYLQMQTKKPGSTGKKSFSRYWIWAIVAGLGGLTLGLALTAQDSTSGDLRIQVSR